MKLSELKELAEKNKLEATIDQENVVQVTSSRFRISATDFLALLADREQLREALQYYADYKKWGAREMFGAFRGIPLEDCDQVAGGLTGGKTARAALKRSEELEK